MIQTGSSITNHPITKLYPLKVRSKSPPEIEQNADNVNDCDDDTSSTVMTQPSSQSKVREAATKAHLLLSEWT